MKRKIKKIAMRCTQEQFDSIKDTLIEDGLEICNVTSFELNPYLTNAKKSGTITNVKYNQIGVTVYEVFNADKFLNTCRTGVKTKLDSNLSEKYDLIHKAKELISETNKQGMLIEIIGNKVTFEILDNGK